MARFENIYYKNTTISTINVIYKVLMAWYNQWIWLYLYTRLQLDGYKVFDLEGSQIFPTLLY